MNLKDAAVHEKRVLQPTILETKENLLTALRTGSIKTSKYNLLSEEEKLFVELVAFGEYSPETAVRCIHEDIGTYAATYARRLMVKKEVIETLDELTDIKDKSFRASLAKTRQLALKKLEFIMISSKDESLQLQAAKIILDKSNEVQKMKSEGDGQVGGIRINIAVDKVNMNANEGIIPIDAETIKAEFASKGLEVEAEESVPVVPINPETGKPYVINYESVDSYDDDDEKD